MSDTRKIMILFRSSPNLQLEATSWYMGEDALDIYSGPAKIASFYRDTVLGVREVNPSALRKKLEAYQEEREKQRAKAAADEEAGIFPAGDITELKEKGWQ